MNKLSYQLNTELSPADIANLWVRDEDNRLLCIIHVNTTYGATLEVIDFDRYGDYLGTIVKAAKILKAAKASDMQAVKAVLDSFVEYKQTEEA